MSTMKPGETNNDLEGPARYAPKWLREAQAEQASSNLPHLPRAPQLMMPQEPARSLRGLEPVEHRLDHLTPRHLEPQLVAEPRQPERKIGLVSMAARLALVVAVAAAGAFVLVSLPFGSATRDPAGGDTKVAHASEAGSPPPVPRTATSPAKVPDKISDMRASGATPSAAQAAGGLVADAPLSSARPQEGPVPGDAKPAPVASLSPWPTGPRSEAPPAEQAGPSAPLPNAPQPAPPEPVPQAAPQPAPSPRAVAPEEIEALLRRGQTFMRQGDISAARAALKRAAETGDARAALALGATYDPNELKEMGAIGIKSDVAQALAWYMKAAEYGSAEAPKRIALLPQR